MLEISPELAEQLGNFMFVLAVNTIVEGSPLGDRNRIKAVSVTVDEPSSTSCPDPQKTPLTCGCSEKDDDCELQTEGMKGKEPICKSGKFKGCKCVAPKMMFHYVASDEEQKAMIHISQLLRDIDSVPRSPERSHKDLSVIPSNVFGSGQNNAHHEFCEKWNMNDRLQMTVDAAGKNKRPSPLLMHSIQPRAPPPNADNWYKYDFQLGFQPHAAGKKCSVRCEEAFSHLTRGCRNTQAGSVGTVMAKKGKLDVGCGVFDYSIVKNATLLEAFPRHCYHHDEFGDPGGETQGHRVKELTATPCWGSGIDPIKRGDPSTFRTHATVSAGVPYQLNIWWKGGCTMDDTDELLASNSPNLKNQDGRFCQETLYDNWKRCNNKGVGRRIQAGCLVSEFKAARKD